MNEKRILRLDRDNIGLLGIVIATYNEAENLPDLIRALVESPVPSNTRIYIIDDNSPDGTSDIALSMAKAYNLFITTRPRKLGLGSAIKTGIFKALKDGCSHILTMDADFSHNPKDVPRLLEAVRPTEADIIQASRFMQGGGIVGLVWYRKLQSHIANLLCNRLLGAPQEATTNFRIYSRNCAELVLKESRTRDFEFQPESILIAMRHGLAITEIPIYFHARSKGTSKIVSRHYLRWGMFFLFAVMSVRLGIGRLAKIKT